MEVSNFRSSIDANDIENVMEIVKTYGGNETQLASIKKYISRELEELGSNRILFLLEQNNLTVGMVQLILNSADDDPDLADGMTIAHIHSLQISKNLHRNGLGFLTMQFLEKEAFRLGIRKLTLGVDQDNVKAINLYKKLNYNLLKEAEGRTAKIKLYYLQKELI